jgi:hypothetical protein
MGLYAVTDIVKTRRRQAKNDAGLQTAATLKALPPLEPSMVNCFSKKLRRLYHETGVNPGVLHLSGG